MSTMSDREGGKPAKKPGIPRISHHITRSSVSKALNSVIGKENTKSKDAPASRRLSSRPSASIPKEKETQDTSEANAASSDATTNSKLVPSKSPLVSSATPVVGVAAMSIPKSTRNESVSSSPKSVRKLTTPITNTSQPQVLKPRESTVTSLPKYKPKATLLPPKQVTLSRKRRNSVVEVVDEDDSLDNGVRIAERPISPLPRRSRVTSTMSTASLKIFDPKALPNLSPLRTTGSDLLRTPIRSRVASTSSPSSIRIRTFSTANASSRLSTGKPDSPLRRTDKRPRLSSESRTPGNSSLLTASTSGLGDLSSDSIDIADVSALLSVSPNVSPAKSILVPRSARRVTRSKPDSDSNPSTPTRKLVTSTLPSRHLSPNAASARKTTADASSQRRPPLRNAGKDRGSVLSWGDFSKVKFGDPSSATLLADMTPLKGIATPSDVDPRLRERVDSGWGLEDMTRMRGGGAGVGVGRSGMSIGQIMFPGAPQNRLIPKVVEPVDHGDEVTTKLWQLKLSETEHEVRELQARIKMLESGIPRDQPPTSSLMAVPFPSEDDAISLNSDHEPGRDLSSASKTAVVDVEMVNELSLRRLQTAELEARGAFLEETLSSTRGQLTERDEQLERARHALEELETEHALEREAWTVKMGEYEHDAVKRVEKVEKGAREREKRKERVDEALLAWTSVRVGAKAELEGVRQMQATLDVLKAGLKVMRVE